MAQQIILNGESGLDVRNALNDMFAELYGLVLGYTPIKLTNVIANTIQAIPGNTLVAQIALIATSGTPTIRIGTTPNGIEIMDDTVIDGTDQQLLQVQEYFLTAGNLYITFTSGSGALNIRIDVIYNYN